MFLKGLSYPCLLRGHGPYRFARPIPVLSMVTNQVLDFIHGWRILQWNHDHLNPRSFEEYTYAVTRKGAHSTTALALLM